MKTSDQSVALSRLKFRVTQPVDIPRCYELECSAYPPEVAASKSTLQHRQHHAAPFFRCVLLKSEKGAVDEKKDLKLDKHASLDENGTGSSGDRQRPDACHHVHHSPHNQLIGYVCATRCHDVANTNQLETSSDADSGEDSNPCPYPMKHEPNGRYLAIRSIVVEKEHQRMGVARALLEYYIKSIEIHNAELDEAGLNRRRNKLKAKKHDAKVEKILVLTRSSMANLFLSVDFRWRATVENGEDSLYEMERVIKSSPPLPQGPLHPHPLMEQDCFLVDAFANPKEYRSGNPAAIIVLQDDPARLIADYYNNIDTDQLDVMSKGGDPVDTETVNILLAAKAVQEEEGLAEAKAQAWMQAVAKEFNQPATAFVWPIAFDKGENSLRRQNSMGRRTRRDSISSEISDDDLNLSSHDESSEGQDTIQHFIRYYNHAGVEVDRCAHATFASASVLFSRYTVTDLNEKGLILSFHSRKDIALQASLAPPSLTEKPCESSAPNPSPQALVPEVCPEEPPPKLDTPKIYHPVHRVAITLPWRTVEPVPPGPGGQGAVLALLRRSFFRAWSVVEPDETDELAFSLSASHVTFVGVTSDGEDLLIELSVEGFNMLNGKFVDYDALRQGWNGFTNGVIICCEVPETKTVSEVTLNGSSESNGDSEQIISEESPIDFRSRYFEPKFANEDPVSGWSHCALAPYFAARRGKQRLFGQQISDRDGLVECILDESEQQVCIVGVAVRTLVGKTLMRA